MKRTLSTKFQKQERWDPIHETGKWMVWLAPKGPQRGYKGAQP